MGHEASIRPLYMKDGFPTGAFEWGFDNLVGRGYASKTEAMCAEAKSLMEFYMKDAEWPHHDRKLKNFTLSEYDRLLKEYPEYFI